jgi:tetratricopeptide (TPR) repeat protein
LFSAPQTEAQSNKTALKIDSLIDECIALRESGDFSRSDSLLTIAKQIISNSPNSKKEIEVFNQMAINATVQGRLEEAIKNFNNAITLCKNSGSKKRLANLYENISLAYQDMGRYKEAIDTQFKSLEIRQNNNLKKRIPANLKKIANIYDELGNIEKHEEYIRKALVIIESDSSIKRQSIVAIYNEMGNLFDNKKQYDSSAYYYQLVIDEGEKIGWKRAVSTGVGNLANIYKKQGKLDKALTMHFKAAELETEAGNAMGLCQECLAISEIYQIKNLTKNGINWALKADSLAKNNKFTKIAMDAAIQLSELYEDEHRYKAAYQYLKSGKDLSDSIAQYENQEYIAKIDSKYQNRLKAKKIELLKAQKKIADAKLQYISIFIILVLVIGVMGFQYYRRRNIYRTNELKLQALSAQMNPHFIFNVLGAIQSYMYKNDAKTAAYFLERFAKLSRAILESVEKRSISLEQEMENIKIFIELEQFRFNNSFDFEIDCDADDPEFIQIPPMILQPFVENAIKHGLANNSKNALLSIKIKGKTDEVIVVIEDNGPGFVTSANKKHQSKSLSILKNRRLLMQRQLKRALDWKIENISDTESHKSGVRISINLPIMGDE